MFTRPSVSGDRKAANLCKSNIATCSGKRTKSHQSHQHIEREKGDLIWIIYHANILPIWQNISNQIKQVLARNTYILKPGIQVKIRMGYTTNDIYQNTKNKK
jgi:hypothetical protein